MGISSTADAGKKNDYTSITSGKTTIAYPEISEELLNSMKIITATPTSEYYLLMHRIVLLN